MPEISRNIKSSLLMFFIIGFGILIYFLCQNQQRKEDNLEKNSKYTIGKISDFSNSSNRGGEINYLYLINKIWLEGSDPNLVSWPKHIRDGEIKKGDYHQVEYDSLNHQYSKIIIKEKPLSKEEIDQFTRDHN